MGFCPEENKGTLRIVGLAQTPLFSGFLGVMRMGGMSLPIGAFLAMQISCPCWFTRIPGKVTKALISNPNKVFIYLWGTFYQIALRD